MRHRIRAAALVTDDDRVLLVEHRDPATGHVFWVTPGGGLKGEESVLDCAVRETWEETGLTIQPDRIVYLREWIQKKPMVISDSLPIHHLEIFITCRSFIGDLTLKNVAGRGPDEDFITRVDFLSREQVQDLVIYPVELKDSFWVDLAAGFPQLGYLGITFD